MAFKNPYIGYTERSYEQIKQSILSKFPVFVPELTDNTENNILVRMISIWAGIAEMLGYYIDNVAREVYLSTARRYDSARKISELFDYRIRGPISASVDITFTINAPLATDFTIDAGTILNTQDGIVFITINPGVILSGDTEVLIPAVQQLDVAEITVGSSNGLINQSFELTSGISDKSIKVIVGTVEYEFKDSLAFSNSTDQVFTSSLNDDQNMEIRFGNNIQGLVPPIGTDIKVTYATTSGALGNVSDGAINNLVTPITIPNSGTIVAVNENRSSGGADVESLDNLRKNIPLSIRTLSRAVTRQDYVDISELVPGVSKADVRYDCGTSVDVFIVPEGGGIANQTLLDTVKLAFHDSTRMIITEVNPRPAGEILVILDVRVRVNPVFNSLNTIELVKTNLKEFIGVDNQDISGEVNIGDIYQVMENTDGVDTSEVVFLSLIPTARIISGTTELEWAPRILPTSLTEITWRIKHLNSTTYEVQQGQNILGVFNYGDDITLTELTFNVANTGYSVGDIWEFITYRYSGSISLNEPSIAILRDINLTISQF